jgi:uncharacterized SAM-binding protein YcdF (DUF218 family)
VVLQRGKMQMIAIRRPRRRSFRLWLGVSVLLMAAGLAVLTWRLFVSPVTDPPRSADAVVVFAGGDGERQAAGIRLIRAGVARVLVVSDGGYPNAREDWTCPQESGFRVVCLTPKASSTKAEARAFGELAGRENWRSLVVITSPYHLRRASLNLSQCYQGKLFTMVAKPLHDEGRFELVGEIGKEWVGLLGGLTVRRGC